MEFKKPSTTIEQQINLLKQRGMLINDETNAEHYLTHIGYYRLRGYWLVFEINPGNSEEHQFSQDTSFEQVLELYIFDRELRLLILDAIERIEVSLRNQWVKQLSTVHGPHAYLDAEIFRSHSLHGKSLATLIREIENSKERFIKHYKTKYSNPDLPPIWAASAVMTLGQLSRWFANLKLFSDRSAIAKPYELDERVLQSFVHHLNFIRNICAHHSRIWNRQLTITMELPKSKPKELTANFNRSEPRKLYNTLVMLEYLMEKISPGTHWKQRLCKLFQDHPVANPAAMGFPENWQERAIWEEVTSR